MAQLKLDQVVVHVAKDKAAGSDPAPAGLHVYLDVPGGNFDFNHFVVDDKQRLVPDQGTTPVPLDTRWNHWALWAKKALTLPTSGAFDLVDEAFDAPAGKKRWPLPSKFTTQAGKNVLVLPNKLGLKLRTFDLCLKVPPDTAATESVAKRGDLDRAVAYYDQLLIDIIEDKQPRPDPATHKLPWLVWRIDGGGKRETVIAQDFGQNVQQIELKPQPDFAKAPWADGQKTIICIWVREFLGAGLTNGQAWMMLRVFADGPVSQNEKFGLAAGPLVIMPEVRKAASTNSFPHELGHVLLHDPGLGRAIIEANKGKEKMKAFLAKLGVEGPAPQGMTPGELLYGSLFGPPAKDAHAPAGSQNLMRADGGTTLVPWQVAVIRAARETQP